MTLPSLLARTAVAAVLLLGLSACTIGGDDHDTYGSGLLEAGTLAPDFTLVTDDRPEGFALSSLQGRYVLLEFWASWCPDCQEATAAVKQLHDDYAPQGVVFVGVSFDTDEAQWRQYISDNGLDWLQHREQKPWKESPLSTAYHINWIPTFYLISPDGLITEGTVDVQAMGRLLAGLPLSDQ